MASKFIPSIEQRNAVWGTTDQIVSGLSNVLLLLTVAKVATPSQLGALSATVVALTSLLSVSRAGLGTHVLLTAGGSKREIKLEAGRTTALVVVLAPLVSAFVAAVGILAGRGEAPEAVVLVAMAAPFVLVQDLLRCLCSARLESRVAFISDLLWAIAAGLGFVLLNASSSQRSSAVGAAVGFWLVGCLAAFGTLAIYLKWRPVLRGLWHWFRANASFLVNATGGTAAIAAANTLRVFSIGAIVGPLAVGALAAGQLLMTPLNLLVAVIPFIAMPLVVRKGGSRNAGVARIAYLKVALGSFALSIVWWAACLAIPDRIGSSFLGEAWKWAEGLLTPMILMSIGILLTASASSLLLTIGRSKIYAISSICIALASSGAALIVSLGSGGVEALAWAQTGILCLGALATFSLALGSAPAPVGMPTANRP